MTSILEQFGTDFASTLVGDIVAILERKSTNGPRERRSLIRAIFAAVEGILEELCYKLLTSAETGLTAAQCMALQQQSVRVDENGSIKLIDAFQPLKHRVRLTVEIVKHLHPEYAIDFGDKGWQQLLIGLDTRHRVTHPKSLTDLEVSDRECSLAVNGFFWFLMRVVAGGNEGIIVYMTAHLKALESEQQDLLDTIRALESDNPH
jgi:hypothetical protein